MRLLELTTKEVDETEENLTLTRAEDRPYQPCSFLPEKIHRQTMQFLVDTGCNTNLLS